MLKVSGPALVGQVPRRGWAEGGAWTKSGSWGPPQDRQDLAPAGTIEEMAVEVVIERVVAGLVSECVDGEKVGGQPWGG